jgi:O-antigen/teichoic acid export membrane protein
VSTATNFRPRRGIGAQALLMAVATGLSQLATAAMYILAARHSRPADFGIVVASIAAGLTVTGLADFGSNTYWIREIARGQRTGRSLSARVTAKMLVAALAAAMIAVVVLFVAPGTAYWCTGLVGLGTLAGMTWRVPLAGTGRADLMAIPVLVERFSGLLLLVVLDAMGVSASSALWIALLLGSLLSAVVAHLLTPKPQRFAFALSRAENPWSGARSYGLFTVVVSAQTLDVTLLSALGSPTAAGTYGAVSRWTQPISLITNAFASSAAPFIAHSGDIGRAWRQIRRAMWLPVAAIAGSVVLAVAAPWVIRILLGDEYAGSAPVLRLLALASAPAVVNQVCAVALQSLGHDRAVARILVGTALVELSLVCALASPLGALGAAIALTIVHCLTMIALVAYFAVIRGRTPVQLADAAAPAVADL